MKQHFKKIILSVAVIAGIALYLVYERSGSSIKQADTNPAKSQENQASSGISYKNGEYVGDVTDAYFGNMQVKVIIENEKISDVVFLQYPNDRQTSIEINTSAMPVLKSEVIAAQDAHVDIVSGATQTSEAFIESLKSALLQAKKA